MSGGSAIGRRTTSARTPGGAANGAGVATRTRWRAWWKIFRPESSRPPRLSTHRSGVAERPAASRAATSAASRTWKGGSSRRTVSAPATIRSARARTASIRRRSSREENPAPDRSAAAILPSRVTA